MVLPRTLKWSNDVGFLPLSVSFTCLRCVFMLTSTPTRGKKFCRINRQYTKGFESSSRVVYVVIAHQTDASERGRFGFAAFDPPRAPLPRARPVAHTPRYHAIPPMHEK